MKPRPSLTNALIVLLPIVPLVVYFPMLASWAGDAVIHLRVAELCSRGHWFEFNMNRPVMASTSLLWTFFLTVFFKLFGVGFVPWVVKVFLTLVWYATGLLTYVTWKQLFSNTGAGLTALVLFAFNPGLFQNSVNGMESVLAAFLYAGIFYVLFFEPIRHESLQGGILLFLGAASPLARPEGMMLCGVLGLLRIVHRRRIDKATGGLLIGGVLSALVTFAASYFITGSVIPDSALARKAAGLRTSVTFGPLAIHLRSAERFLAYLPITAGLAASAYLLTRPQLARKLELRSYENARFRAAVAATVAVTLVMLFFYSFIVGATHTIRYWLPYFSFIAGAGGGTLYTICAGLQSRGAKLKKPALILFCSSCVWMGGAYVSEAWLRGAQGLGYRQESIVEAVRNRPSFTMEYLEKLGASSKVPVKVACTEVQLRYFLSDDGKVVVLSLDGRTAPRFSKYMDPRTGLRKFDILLRDERPNYVELGEFDPREPVLPAVERMWKQGYGDISVAGFHFRRTKMPKVVEFLGAATAVTSRTLTSTSPLTAVCGLRGNGDNICMAPWCWFRNSKCQCES